MWERAQQHHGRIALAVVGLVLAALGVFGVIVGREPVKSTPLVTAPAWVPPAALPTSAAPLPVSPSPSLSPTRPDTVEVGQNVPARPRATSPTPVVPLLAIAAGEVPGVVDLSKEGVRDWIHWGVSDAKSVDRKWGVTAAIQDLGSPGPRGRYDNNPQVFNWSDGDPNWAVTGTPTGIYACGQGAGFTIQAAAVPTTRTLHLYAGAWMAKGQLVVTLGGTSATRTMDSPAGISTRRWDIKFRAAAGSRLTVSWTATQVYNTSCGNVDMQAATLS
ncbi:hypothetical protein [Actinoplanes sp. NPDC026619]|uniref:hypothetical protein n=1 Tax=Actinoplanes sp. NPDC026619 TaxID=3155798 RepID=UPI0033EE8793